MKKHIANILSSVRIVLATVLMRYNDFTAGFLKLFCVAGLTDLLDGPIARATKSVSIRGAKLDTAGDVLTYAAIGKILLVKSKFSKVQLYLIGASILAYTISAIIAYAKFGKFFFVHNILSKALGVGLFLMPFASILDYMNVIVPVVCALFLLASAESVIIQAKSSVADADTLSIFSIK